MNWKTALLLHIICLSYQAQGSGEINNSRYSDESKHPGESTLGSQHAETFQKMSRASTVKRLFELSKLRTKRSSAFPTGVKVCPRESEKQILASHMSYYRLRVCQEAVWEAYRIFLDRIPYTSEYQHWVDACQHESFCLLDIGKNFSKSQEHLELIHRRVKEGNFQESKDVLPTEKTASDSGNGEHSATMPLDNPSTTFASTQNEPLLNEIVNDTKTPVKEVEITNTVPEQPTEQIVEFTVTLTNQRYTEELSDPSSVPYQELAASFQLQMQKVFEKLPGFKEIRVIMFRQKKEDDGTSSIAVSYAVVFQRGGSEAKPDIEENPVIASNKVENGNQELEETAEEGTVAEKYTVTELQEMVAMALHDDQSLPVDLRTLHFVQDRSTQPAELENDIQPLVTITEAGTELDDTLNAARPLDNPSPEIEEHANSLFSAQTTSNSMLEHIEQDSNNNATQEPRGESNTEAILAKSDLATAFPKESLSEKVTETLESSGDSLLAKSSTDSIPYTLNSPPSMPPADELWDMANSLAPATAYDAESNPAPDSSDVVQATLHMLTPDTFSESAAEKEAVISPMVTPEMITVPGDSRNEDVSTSSASSYSHSIIDQSFFHVFPSSSPTLSSLPALGSSVPPSFAVGVQDIAAELDKVDSASVVSTEEVDYGSTYISMSDPSTAETTAPPTLKYLTTSSMTTTAKGKELVVFFSLRVTNMPFSDDLFNRSSLEYKSLEQQLMQLLLPYLKTNLTGFKQLEILNFRNGSVIVNSKMKFAKSVPYNITEAVHCVLEDFCDAAAQRLHLEIDSYSLDVEPADQADPCKFMACDAFSECIMNSWTREADCLCKPGYLSTDGLPCQSLCDLEPNLCVNEGKCEIVSEKGAVCRSPEESQPS
ncbi:interphotoreceptor matrix proteoglycan 1 isoform X2 [Ambystoma mexicanum]|uniref:interphotoreceptor matrix proteoglycan 1 isoform X2 n=1 Tax=Ambystoma mexicanum TaxID=8296 RepID=UPI0037E7F66D